MANQRKGLGRGLSALLGESVAETTPRAAEPKKETIKEESKIEERAAAASNEPVFKPQIRTTVTEEAAEAATVVERPASVPAKSTQKAATSAVESAARRAALNSDVAKPTPYVEEDDHTTIKEVLIREPRDTKRDEEVPLSQVHPNRNQPRMLFNETEIDELATSISREGLLQPILVRKVDDGYEIIAGERRYRACVKLGLKTVPIRIRDVEDDKVLELALIENIQRSDLNPIEEAYGYKRLMEHRGMTQSDVAQVVSKARSTVANALRLLDLPEEAQELLFNNEITAGHARAILAVPTEEGRKILTQKIKEDDLNVRSAENLSALLKAQATGGGASKREPTPKSFKKAARELRERLKTNVRIKTVKGKNKIEIEFADEDELKRIFEAITAES